MREYYFLDKESDCIEYKLEVLKDDITTYSLYRIGDSWTEDSKEGPCVVLHDDGDGVTIDIEEVQSYCDLQELYLLIKGMLKHDNNLMSKFIILK
jgi:hypothetical protein